MRCCTMKHVRPLLPLEFAVNACRRTGMVATASCCQKQEEPNKRLPIQNRLHQGINFQGCVGLIHVP